MNIQIRLSIFLAGALLAIPLSASNLKIADFTIEPQGAAVPAGREMFVQLLASAATDQAARSLARKGATIPAGQLTVKGSVRMAVSLPPGVRGLAAARRKGSLATASVQLVDQSGNVVAAREASIAWSGVRWLAGARHGYRHSRSIEEVLLDGVRLSVDRAVEDLRDRIPGQS